MINSKTVPYKASSAEYGLLLDLTKLGYGELSDVEIPEGPRVLDVQVTASRKKLLDLLRSGVHEIARLVVHDGEPVSADVRLVAEHSRAKGTKRYKFN